MRKKALVKLADGQETAAWVYEFADPDTIADHPPAMVDSSGDLPVYEWTNRKRIE